MSDLTPTPVEKRKEELKKGLISDTPTKPVDPPIVPTKKSVNAFNSEASLAGPFARKKIQTKIDTKDKTKTPPTPEHIFKIWDDKPVKNVGGDTNSYTKPKGK